ncbi:MAG: hypothetical protein EA417_02085 [Gammaproteobacteria bacterium]|nr:MAG: hypothetical protein EA417_02085 [Gammaproteobacteria bacterium]
MPDRDPTADMIEQLDPGPDPYPALPVMPPEALRDGDVLMMLGQGYSRIGKLPVPVSLLIRALDGGAYSHSAVVSIIDGEPKVWDHSADWLLGPVSLDDGIRNHAWCHVYRLFKHGEHVGSSRYPSAPIVKALAERQGDAYDTKLLLTAGVVAVVSRMPANPHVRELARRALEAAVEVINWYLDRKDIRSSMLICTAVTGLSYWNAVNAKPHDYALEVDIQRRGAVDDHGSEDWKRTIAKVKAALSRVWPDFPDDLARFRKTQASNAHWVEVGGQLLPVNLVSPSDLEFSRTLERVGRLHIPQ